MKKRSGLLGLFGNNKVKVEYIGCRMICPAWLQTHSMQSLCEGCLEPDCTAPGEALESYTKFGAFWVCHKSLCTFGGPVLAHFCKLHGHGDKVL